MAKVLLYNTVKTALQKDGWRIAHDPYQLRYGVADVYIDLAAEAAIAAEKEGRKITVEVKAKSVFPNEESVYKLMYMAMNNIAQRWSRPIKDWKAALSHFAILFPERFQY